MTEIKIDFSNTKVAKFYQELDGHLKEIENIPTSPTTSSSSKNESANDSKSEQKYKVEEFVTYDQ